MRLNYRHLHYFQAVAREGNLTHAAARLNLSQSALSTQIRQLEDRFGHALFERTSRAMILTEAGRIALDHAERIFDVGEDLVATMTGTGRVKAPLRVGALSTLSRNFQLQFLRPILSETGADLVLSSGNSQGLLRALEDLALDVVLLTDPPPRDTFPGLVAHRIDEQPVAIHGTARRLGHGTLAGLLAAEPVILPTESSIRTGFDSLVARLGVTPRIAAVVDDMAMVRLLARDDVGLAITPAVVLADELAQGLLVSAPFELDIVESFYAVTAPRTFPHPLVARLIAPADGAENGSAV
ncbi:LysR family transcriptional regulator, transcriptional activator of nhaA [Mameliella alba]|uniref:LysR family transcriptional regulator n=1 Tax=Mameliella alba TaxID=561184 RepID=UPI000881C374|nr:LysR family transcriptional regulator [Mameliella alba]OWV48795.1 LysR family transcriptional regulator [Mameliella alba]PTR39370.1 LysR family transcriptional activator of nhaA [Mameliella alba]GGF65385.1 LysR family transcriptional regulator [Mameliella alba]SDD32407.1 LysR family transcriptional regulator, transcriptional activator of nhaA [Mameliella alba]